MRDERQDQPTPVGTRLCFASAWTVLLLGSLSSVGLGSAAVTSLAAVPENIAGVARDLSGAPHAHLRRVADSPAQDQYGPPNTERLTICHRRTGNGKRVAITIKRTALAAHLAHGDTLGACPTVAGFAGERKSGGVKSGEDSPSAPRAMLASTGVSLTLTLLLSLLLIAAGLALRGTRDGR